MYEYRATVEKAHDGDTITVLLDQGLNVFTRRNIRFFGINAPELSTPEGHPALEHLLKLLGPLPATVVIRTIKDHADAYPGRWDGNIWLESAGMWGPDFQFLTTNPSINQQMVDDGFAVAKTYK